MFPKKRLPTLFVINTKHDSSTIITESRDNRKT